MKSIRVGGVPEHFNYPWHIGLKKGLFKEQNINVTWQDFYGGTGELSRALHNDEIDVALVLTEGIIKEIEDGAPFKIIQEYIATPLIWGIHVAAESDYEHMNELENTTSAISRFGSGSHLMTYVNAKNEKWDTRNLKFEVVKNLEGAVKALPNDDAQYFMWEHFTTKPLVDNGTFRRITDCPTPWPCFVIVSKDDFIADNSSDLKNMLNTLNGITKDFKSIPKISTQLAKNYQQNEEDILEWLDLTEWSQKQINSKEVKIIQDQLEDLNLITQKSNFKNICKSIG